MLGTWKVHCRFLFNACLSFLGKMIFSELCLPVIARIVEEKVRCNHKRYIYCDILDYIPDEFKDSANTLLLPHIVVWDPLNHINGINLKCPHCSEGNVVSKLTATDDWEDGSRNSLTPRTIWDITWYIALVGRLYSYMLCKA